MRERWHSRSLFISQATCVRYWMDTLLVKSWIGTGRTNLFCPLNWCFKKVVRWNSTHSPFSFLLARLWICTLNSEMYLYDVQRRIQSFSIIGESILNSPLPKEKGFFVSMATSISGFNSSNIRATLAYFTRRRSSRAFRIGANFYFKLCPSKYLWQ